MDSRLNHRLFGQNFLGDVSPGEIENSYASQSYQRQRQLTLGDLLLENRIVFLQGEIHTGNANEVVMKLLYLQSEKSPQRHPLLSQQPWR